MFFTQRVSFSLTDPVQDPNTNKVWGLWTSTAALSRLGSQQQCRIPHICQRCVKLYRRPQSIPLCSQSAFQSLMPIDLDAPEDRQVLNITVVTQITPDIRVRLQKLKGYKGMYMFQLLEVFNNREPIERGDLAHKLKPPSPPLMMRHGLNRNTAQFWCLGLCKKSISQLKVLPPIKN